MKITITAAAFVLLIVLATTCFFELKATAERFVGSGAPSGSFTNSLKTFAGIRVQGSQTIQRFDPERRYDIELDDTAQTIQYNEFGFQSLDNVVITVSENYIIPGTFTVVPVNTAVEFSSIAATATNVGPLDIIVPPVGSRVAVELNNDGHAGQFGPIHVIGVFSVAGPTESFTGTFDLMLPLVDSGGFYSVFPESQLDVLNFPDSVLIGSGTNRAPSHIEYNDSSKEPVVLFDGLVDGLPFEVGISRVFLEESKWVDVHNTATMLAGDFDHNGSVDSADLSEWEQAYGYSSGADADMDWDSDGSDFLIWQRNLGISMPMAAPALVVPEPTTCTLALAALFLAMSRRRAF